MSAEEWDKSTRGTTIGHDLWAGNTLLHIVRYRLEGPAAIHRQTLCGNLARAVIVDSGVLNPETHEIDPTKAQAFRQRYSNGWLEYPDPKPNAWHTWCARCHQAYRRQLAKHGAA